MKYKLSLQVIKRNKTNILISLVTLLAVFGVIQYKIYEKSTRGVKVVLGKKPIGIARNKSEVLSVISEIEEDLSKEFDNDIKINEEVAFISTHVKDQELTTKDSIKKNIEDNLTFSAVCYAIKVDGKEVSYLKTKNLADKAIEEVKKPYTQDVKSEDTKIKDIKTVENVEVVETKKPISTINDIDTTIDELKSGNIEEKIHIMKKDENYWTMSLDYNIDMKEIEKANPGKDSRNIKPGEEVVVPVAKPYLTVVTIEEEKSIKEVDFKTEYEIDDSLYDDEEKVKVEGVKGETEVVSKVEKHNGAEISREVLSETVLSEPTTEIKVKGTKKRPAKSPTGTFETPARGYISSGFGQRWGKLHAGIDIAAREGEPIKASDGGTVNFAGFNNGGYGYMVDINHGNGYVTRYAHCSKLYVSSGEKVGKGDVIAAVGNTGRSFGPHLHFEVRKNGTPQNPSDYLK